jgi:hypothetical protein
LPSGILSVGWRASSSSATCCNAYDLGAFIALPLSFPSASSLLFSLFCESKINLVHNGTQTPLGNFLCVGVRASLTQRKHSPLVNQGLKSRPRNWGPTVRTSVHAPQITRSNSLSCCSVTQYSWVSVGLFCTGSSIPPKFRKMSYHVLESDTRAMSKKCLYNGYHVTLLCRSREN